MTVGELIIKLQQFDQDADVVCPINSAQLDYVENVEQFTDESRWAFPSCVLIEGPHG